MVLFAADHTASPLEESCPGEHHDSGFIGAILL
jgi:hypothetical protein